MAMRRDKAIKFLKEVMYMAQVQSKDPETKVGCFLVSPDDFTVLSRGYNGLPRLFPDTEENWSRPLKYMYVRHAERNAIDNAARKGTNVEGAICIVSRYPCADCAGSLAQINCKEIVCLSPTAYSDFAQRYAENIRLTKHMLDTLGIELTLIEPNELEA